MKEFTERTIRSSQEQAVASWITFLNQCRLNELVEQLQKQSANQREALTQLAYLKDFIGNPSNILGSMATKHGEIAEHMQVNISNARQAIKGLNLEYSFEGVARTGPEDYLHLGHEVQSKFHGGLRATFFNKNGLFDHYSKYPNFVVNGGIYDIPMEQFQKMVQILDDYKNNSSQLRTSEYMLAKRIDVFLNESGLEVGRDIRPSVVKYEQVQLMTAFQTVTDEEKQIRKTNKEIKKEIYQKSKPSIQEGTKVASVSAAIEGGVSFAMAIAKKRKQKGLKDFTISDWKEIGIDTGTGAVKGGIRGGAIYTLTNFSSTPANVASAYVTAAFGITSQIRALNMGEISEEDFFINSEIVCLDVAVSAISSLIGQVMLPVPVLGAVIGNITGELLYEYGKKMGSKKTRSIIEQYNSEIQDLTQKMKLGERTVILELEEKMKRFESFEELAFDMDVNRAFQGSILLAEELGVSDEKILHDLSEIIDFCTR